MIIDPIATRLDAVTQAHPELTTIAEYYRTILPLIHRADLRVEPLELSREQIEQKFRAGMPLLHQVDLNFDERAARQLLIQLAQALEKMQSAARQVRARAEADRINMRLLFAAVLMGDQELAAEHAQTINLNADLLWTLAQNTFKPALRAWQSHFCATVSPDEWRKAYCFVCGAAPTFGELQGNDQARHLRCGQCGADWFYERLICIYCGYARPDKLKQFYPADQRTKVYVQTCDNCQGYIKNLAAFSPTAPELIAVEDLATLFLDYIARDQGYARQIIRPLEMPAPQELE
ncbi:MAG: formate dehydrogenase accessory protein FdhE [Chloroflexi bacterium]|nr:formate dehydrogenase accessory protein FdhE [Chloroflexota bacterium]